MRNQKVKVGVRGVIAASSCWSLFQLFGFCGVGYCFWLRVPIFHYPRKIGEVLTVLAGLDDFTVEMP